jgi:hypothetical protein
MFQGLKFGHVLKSKGRDNGKVITKFIDKPQFDDTL